MNVGEFAVSRRAKWTPGERLAIREAFHEAARRAVAIAVRKRELTAVPCEVCGAKGRTEAHHYKGYNISNWLDVRWLCKKCHRGAEGSRPPCDCPVCAWGN